jgi:cellulose synthase/poly-beta-1,6-N-acetylglucosamine synthase-like glycosyltransferase
MEALVADGMSTDDTREIIRELQSQHDNLRLIQNRGKIVSTGINGALAQARGDIIILVGGHCEIATDYVRRCVESLARSDVGVVGGPIETVGQTTAANIIAAALSSPFGVGGAAFRTVKDRAMLVDTVAFAAYRRDVIERAGPFDEELVRDQDDEYNYRLRKMGVQILMTPEIHSKYFSRVSLRALGRQYLQYGYWKVRVTQKHPRQMRLRQFVPSAFVIALFGSAVLAPIAPFGWLLFGLVAGSYALGNLAASFWTAHKGCWRFFPFLPPVFAILHLGYGFGFLAGLMRFWNRWRDAGTRAPSLSGSLAGGSQ